MCDLNILGTRVEALVLSSRNWGMTLYLSMKIVTIVSRVRVRIVPLAIFLPGQILSGWYNVAL
jgi:hypothetical protein